MGAGLKGWVEIFRIGKHTDAKGKEFNATEKILETIVARYKPEFHEAPAVIGHPTANAPAYAWVESLKHEGGVLFAKFRDVAEEFAEAVEKGFYKKRSISLYPDGSLRHVGFLGATPPAVKGLRNIEFATNDDAPCITLEFSEDALRDTIGYRLQLIGDALGRLRDYMIETDGLEKTDRVLSVYIIDEIKRELPKINPTSFNEKNGDTMTAEEQKKFDQVASDFSEAQKALKLANDEIEKLKADKNKTDLAQATLEESDFCEKLVKEGKMSPAEKDGYVHTLVEQRMNKRIVNFAEKETTTYDVLKGTLLNRPKVWDFEEAATKTKTGEENKSGSQEGVEIIRRSMATQK